MARVKRGNVARNRKKKLFKLTKGFRGPLSKLYRPAHQALLHALTNSYRDRRRKKRDFRNVWIIRINAALELMGLSYSKFIGAASKKEVKINRKMLAELAHSEADVFKSVVEFVNK